MNLEDFSVKLFKALAHPVRLKIVKQLLEKENCVCDLQKDIEDFSQSNLSQHLKILRDAGIVVSTKDGSKVVYNLANPKIGDLISISEGIIKENILTLLG